MNIIARIRLALQDTPDTTAVEQGLTVTRLGRGRYRYSGLPAHMQGWRRRKPDELDRLLCAAYDAPRVQMPKSTDVRRGVPQPAARAV
jgi:hypothetical protein